MISANTISGNLSNVLGRIFGAAHRANAVSTPVVAVKVALPQRETALLLRSVTADGAPVIAVDGTLDAAVCDSVIQEAAALCAAGASSITVDLSHAERIDIGGIFALHAIAAVYSHSAVPDAFSAGATNLPALRRLAEANFARGVVAGLHLVCPHDDLSAKLRNAGIDQVYTFAD
jgi:hypothetical protein